MRVIFAAPAALFLFAFTSDPAAAQPAKDSAPAPAVAETCEELAKKFYSLRDDPVPPEYHEFIMNEVRSVDPGLLGIANPLTACADADVYIRLRRETFAVQRKLLSQCKWKFGTEGLPLTLGNIDRAVADEEKAFAESRDRICAAAAPLAANSRCWKHAIDGELDKALSDCNELLRLKPQDANTLNSRGLVQLKRGAFDDAIADYSAAIAKNAKDAKDAKDADSLYGRGIARIRSGDAAGGEADISAARAIKPDIATIFAGYGVK